MSSRKSTAEDYLSAIRDLAVQVQNDGRGSKSVAASLASLVDALMQQSHSERGTTSLAREVANALRQYLDAQDAIAARTPPLVEQRGWNARLVFLGDALELIEEQCGLA